MKEIIRISRRVTEFSLNQEPNRVFIAAFFIGVGLALFSLVIDIAFFSYALDPSKPGEQLKQVGYIWALNWSAAFIVGFPAMLFFALYTVSGAKSSLQDALARRMILDKSWNPASQESLDAELGRVWTDTAKFGAALFIVFMTYCLLEWFFVSGLHLINNTMPVAEGEAHFFQELDWSVAAIILPEGDRTIMFRVLNGIFSFLNYALLGVYLTIIFTFYIFLVMFSAMIKRLSNGSTETGLRLIPTVNTPDLRRGFDVFERLFQRALFVTGAGFLVAYLMHVQNLYLRNTELDISTFLLDDVKSGFVLFLDGNFSEGLSLLAVAMFSGDGVTNLQSVIAPILVAFVFSVVVLTLAWTLHQSADKSRREYLNYLENSKNAIIQLTELNREKCIERISGRNMKLWPLNWPAAKQLTIYLGFGFLCIILYKFGLLFVGMIIAWITVSVIMSTVGKKAAN